MNFLREILEIAGPNTFIELPDRDDWAKVEKECGCSFSRELKELISHFGSGYFGSSLYFLNPIARGRLRLSAENLIKKGMEIQLLLEDLPLSLFPENNGLIHIAHCGTRMELFLNPSKDNQLVYVDFDLQICSYLDCGASEFIYKLYNGEFIDGLVTDGLRESVWMDSLPFFLPKASMPF